MYHARENYHTQSVRWVFLRPARSFVERRPRHGATRGVMVRLRGCGRGGSRNVQIREGTTAENKTSGKVGSMQHHILAAYHIPGI